MWSAPASSGVIIIICFSVFVFLSNQRSCRFLVYGKLFHLSLYTPLKRCSYKQADMIKVCLFQYVICATSDKHTVCFFCQLPDNRTVCLMQCIIGCHSVEFLIRHIIPHLMQPWIMFFLIRLFQNFFGHCNNLFCCLVNQIPVI